MYLLFSTVSPRTHLASVILIHNHPLIRHYIDLSSVVDKALLNPPITFPFLKPYTSQHRELCPD